MCMHNTCLWAIFYVCAVILKPTSTIGTFFCKLYGFDTFQTRARIAEHGVKEKTSQLFNCKLLHNFDSSLHGKAPAQLSVLPS